MPVFNLYLKKFTLIFLALQILNLSIYNTNFYASNVLGTSKSQVKDINPIDSFAELMVEDVGGLENAFPEPSQKNDKQSGELKQNISFKMIYQDRFTRITEKQDFTVDSRKAELPLFCNNYSYLFWKEINHPPA